MCLGENVFCFLETQKINEPIVCSNSRMRVYGVIPFLCRVWPFKEAAMSYSVVLWIER